MVRSAFIHSALSAFAVASTPTPTPSTSPSPSLSPKPTQDPLARCDRNPSLPYDRPLEIKDTTLDGPDFKLTRYRGYAVWLYIFATWCGPCRYEQPMVTEMARQYRAAGLRTIGVFDWQDGDTDDDVRRWRRNFGVTYPLMRDKTGALTRFVDNNNGYTTFPSHYFITAWGTLWCYRIGTLSEAAARYKIEKLLGTVTLPLPPEPDPTPALSPSPRPTGFGRL